jgi:hypothetical protein
VPLSKMVIWPAAVARPKIVRCPADRRARGVEPELHRDLLYRSGHRRCCNPNPRSIAIPWTLRSVSGNGRNVLIGRSFNAD